MQLIYKEMYPAHLKWRRRVWIILGAIRGAVRGFQNKTDEYDLRMRRQQEFVRWWRLSNPLCLSVIHSVLPLDIAAFGWTSGQSSPHYPAKKKAKTKKLHLPKLIRTSVSLLVLMLLVLLQQLWRETGATWESDNMTLRSHFTSWQIKQWDTNKR